MAKHSILMETGNAVVKRLKENLIPEFLPNDNAVGLCSPGEKGDFTVGVFLYDIRESEDVRISGMLNQKLDRQQDPPVHLNLYYMITVYSDSDVKFRAQEEHRLLGKIVQIMHDNNVIPAAELGGNLIGTDIHVEFQNLSLEEKMRLWNVPDAQYRPSLFYKVSPIEVESTRSRPVSRVSEVVFEIGE